MQSKKRPYVAPVRMPAHHVFFGVGCLVDWHSLGECAQPVGCGRNNRSACGRMISGTHRTGMAAQAYNRELAQSGQDIFFGGGQSTRSLLCSTVMKVDCSRQPPPKTRNTNLCWGKWDVCASPRYRWICLSTTAPQRMCLPKVPAIYMALYYQWAGDPHMRLSPVIVVWCRISCSPGLMR